MRILIVHHLFAPDFAGGGEYVVLEIARGLYRRGADVSVITTGDPSQSVYDGIRVKRLPVSPYRFNVAIGPILAESKQADIIQTFNYHACFPSFLAGKLTGKPVICEMLGLFGREWLRMRGGIAGRIYMHWERFLVRLPFYRTVFLSDFSQEMGLEAGADPKRSVVIVPGISAENYYALDKKDKVLFVGKLDVRKGINDVMAVVRALPDISFEIVGWGEDFARMQAQAPANASIVELKQGRALYEAFARARIFLFPSRAETFGLAVAEAMASGCAIVSSVPLEFAGVRVSPGDQPAMIEAIRRLWQDPALTDKMGKENRHLAVAYNWDKHVDGLWQIYVGALGAAVPGKDV